MNLLDLFLGKANQAHIDTARYAQPAPLVSARISERAEIAQAKQTILDAASMCPEIKGRELKALRRALKRLS